MLFCFSVGSDWSCARVRFTDFEGFDQVEKNRSKEHRERRVVHACVCLVRDRCIRSRIRIFPRFGHCRKRERSALISCRPHILFCDSVLNNRTWVWLLDGDRFLTKTKIKRGSCWFSVAELIGFAEATGVSGFLAIAEEEGSDTSPCLLVVTREDWMWVFAGKLVPSRCC